MRHAASSGSSMRGVGGMIAAGMLLLASGCGQQAGALVWLFSNPKVDIQAEYKLTQGPLLILVDVTNADTGGPESTAGNLITEAMIQQFTTHEVNQMVIPWNKLVELRRLETDYESVAADRLGKRLGAEQVLFLKIEYTRAQTAAEGVDELITGASCKADVRVVNAKATTRGEVRLWPTGRPGTPGRIIETKLDVHQVRAVSTPEDRARLLADRIADEVAKLFYDYEITAHDDSPAT